MITKNRDREAPTFANINLLGRCNANCYFCLGKDISGELAGKNQLMDHFADCKNFKQFIGMCAENNIDKLYLTGQTADGLQYKWIDELVELLQYCGFKVGVRTNGYLALRKMDTIKKMKGGIGYSIHTLRPEVNKVIMGRSTMPDWDKIIPQSGPNVRISIVLNRYNWHELDDLLWFASKYPNVRYIQIRRISTDTRIDQLGYDVELYEKVYNDFASRHKMTGRFYLAEQYQVYGKEVNWWRTVETSCNSFNYFTDGTISSEYFIVEGYLKNYKK